MNEADTFQKVWDACLIKSWREFRKMGEARQMFKSITNLWPRDAKVIRYNKHLPHKMAVRIFVSTYLTSLNNILHKYGREKDVQILRRLQKSKMDCAWQNNNMNSDMQSLKRQTKNATEKLQLNTRKYNNRNQATDWGVTK